MAPPDPDQLPDDADGRDLAAYIGEDIARSLTLRLTAVAAFASLFAGGLVTEAGWALRGACLGAGAVGILALPLVQLAGWRRTRQWLVIVPVLLVCTALVALAFVQRRG